MRAFFAILGLVLCLFETRADELPVIKDSEAARQYIAELAAGPTPSKAK